MEPPIEIGAIFLCLMPFAASISFSWREINVGPCDYLGRRTRRTAPFRFLHAVRTEITKEGPHFLRGTDVVDAWGDTDRDTQRGHTSSNPRGPRTSAFDFKPGSQLIIPISPTPTIYFLVSISLPPVSPLAGRGPTRV